MLSLEEEATMSEPFYPGEWDHEPDDGWPYPDDDSGLLYPDNTFPECEHIPPCTGDREDAPCYDDDEWD